MAFVPLPNESLLLQVAHSSTEQKCLLPSLSLQFIWNNLEHPVQQDDIYTEGNSYVDAVSHADSVPYDPSTYLVQN